MPTYANSINGNEILAKRSQCDYAGNDLQTTYATKSEVTTGLASKQDTISDLATIRSGAADGATAVQPSDLATVATTGAYSDLSGTPTIPTATSDLTNDSGFITLSDVPAQVNADWNSSSGASEILNKPTIPSGSDLVPPYTLPTDEGKVLTVGPSTTYWSTPATGSVTDVEVDGTSVVSGGVASITMPTVDQVYNSASTNAQSGTAVAGAIATKEDAFDVGTGLEMDTSGSTPTLQVEAPVDIVAGPGIVIDNPDGNTLRVSTDEDYEKELYVNTTVPYTDVNAVFTLSEPVTNFERIRVESWNREFQQYQATYEFTIAGSTTSTVFVMSMDHSESTSNIQRLNMRFSYNSDGNLVDKGHILFFGNGSSTATGNQRGLGIHRVVGIHRIANN